MEDENKQKPLASESEDEEPIPFPSDDWFEEPELDRTLEVFEYEIGKIRKKVAFWIESKSQAESRLIMADYEEVDNITQITSTDTVGFNDRMLRECVSHGDPPRYLTQKEIYNMKKHKKSGIYNSLVYRVANRSDIVSPETIQKEKK